MRFLVLAHPLETTNALRNEGIVIKNLVELTHLEESHLRWVFAKVMVPPKSSILIGFSIINHPFGGPTPIFGNIQKAMFDFGDERLVPSLRSHGESERARKRFWSDQRATHFLGMAKNM